MPNHLLHTPFITKQLDIESNSPTVRPVDVDAGYVRNAMRMDWAKEAVRINDPSTGRHLSEARSILVRELIRSGKSPVRSAPRR